MLTLPSAGQTLPRLRKNNLLYVDKTEYIHKIIKTEGCQFLSRPRRFGKSLLLGAMAEALKGNRELFEGLWLGSSGYDFKPCPVVHLTMTGKSRNETQLTWTIANEVRGAARANKVAEAEVDVEGGDPGDMLKKLVDVLRAKTGERVAILIDEYDAPIHSALGDVKLAESVRDTLHDFYSALKSLFDKSYLRLIFVTGVSKFAQASIFSVFNNLNDLTLKSDFNAACGFSLEEFDAHFADYLPGALEFNKEMGLIEASASMGDFRRAILDYYDGYSWDGENRVLNPYSLVKCLADKELDAYWFETGTPTFLMRTIRSRPSLYFNLDNLELTRASLKAVDLADLEFEPLMFQSGYLTVERRKGLDYVLKVPNKEVDHAFSAKLARFLTRQGEKAVKDLAPKTKAALADFDAAAMAEVLREIVNWLTYPEKTAGEGIYQAAIVSSLKTMLLEVDSEVATAKGRYDFDSKLGRDTIYVCEIKVEKLEKNKDESDKDAVERLKGVGLRAAKAQIESRGYDTRAGFEYRVVKRMAVAIVDGTEVAVEIY
jgi:hypothetical protein